MTQSPEQGTTLATGFAPAARRDARTLILGSLPGARSIAAGEYYAHPRNAFWNIIEALYGIPRSLPYDRRLRQLHAEGVALWDVLHASRRPGSLDANIELDSAVANDIGQFHAAHPGLERIAFNGKKAAQLFHRYGAAGCDLDGVETLTLPSTSPAHAALNFDGKLRAWRELVGYPATRPAATGYTES